MARPIEDFGSTEERYAIQLGNDEIYGGFMPWLAADKQAAKNMLQELTDPLRKVGIPKDLHPKIVEVTKTVRYEVTDANPSA